CVGESPPYYYGSGYHHSGYFDYW
nr:immunoglobulin heavy chain junction region [Macaca mulatta]MOW93855.1 immunoglobulin heavy chain junction region [Macaca mulatta]MOW95506.1 immunoglobulin heavy chain junction region [Macaca mulatta]MOW96136.1 immunoglobulin heavy chain junction region [Macaca mulatta]MOW96342.1 immunoglobulin heavy chain junction region [Macaca mulatta]